MLGLILADYFVDRDLINSLTTSELEEEGKTLFFRLKFDTDMSTNSLGKASGVAKLT